MRGVWDQGTSCGQGGGRGMVDQGSLGTSSLVHHILVYPPSSDPLLPRSVLKDDSGCETCTQMDTEIGNDIYTEVSLQASDKLFEGKCKWTHQVSCVLSSESEGCGGDGGGKLEISDDLLPLLLVDHLHQAALLHHQVVQLEQVQHVLGHHWQSVDRCSYQLVFMIIKWWLMW